MKTTIFMGLISVASIALAACGQSASNGNSMNHNAMMKNSNSSTNMNGMDHNSMPMNSNTSMNHSEMKSSPNAASQPFDLQFLDTMTHHHQGAVDMSTMALTKSQNAELKQFVQKIIDDQNKEIGQMKEWRDKWYAGKPMAMNMEMPGMGDSMKMMMGDGMKKMEAATGKDFDIHFLDMMTPHHAGATVMAKEALTKAEHAELKTLATQIIKEQEAEIKTMTEWKAKWGIK
ncbi:MAG: DUF305 domain-containing protein [Pyrinomonadaceae bacterium]